jgi:hypothetical protein
MLFQTTWELLLLVMVRMLKSWFFFLILKRIVSSDCVKIMKFLIMVWFLKHGIRSKYNKFLRVLKS